MFSRDHGHRAGEGESPVTPCHAQRPELDGERASVGDQHRAQPGSVEGRRDGAGGHGDAQPCYASNTDAGTRVLAPVAVQIGPIEDDGTELRRRRRRSLYRRPLPKPDRSRNNRLAGHGGYSLGVGRHLCASLIGPLQRSGLLCEPNDTTLAIVETEVRVGSTGAAVGRSPRRREHASDHHAEVEGAQATSDGTRPGLVPNVLVPHDGRPRADRPGLSALHAVKHAGRKRPAMPGPDRVLGSESSSRRT